MSVLCKLRPREILKVMPISKLAMASNQNRYADFSENVILLH